MDIFESKPSQKLKGCSRCGNPKFTADPFSPFPFCEECVICEECGGLKIVNDRKCKRCNGLGYTLVKNSGYGPGSEEDLYDEEAEEFFIDFDGPEDDIELLSLDDLAEEEFAEFEEEDEPEY